MRHASKRHSSVPIAAVALLSAAVPACGQLSLQQALMLRTHGAAVLASSSVAPSAPPATTESALHDLADQAAVIFAGQVLTIRQESGAMRIDLRVDDGIRGVVSGQTYTMREWSGLWSGNPTRLRVGQRALFLLHAPSVAGYSSPVGGADGVLPLSGDEVTSAVDLRWIAARVVRSAAARPDNAPDGTSATGNTLYPARMLAVAPTAAHLASANANGIAFPADTTNGNVLGPDLRAIDTGLVCGLLRTWKPAETDPR